MSISDLINSARSGNAAVQGIGATVSGISNSVSSLTGLLGLNSPSFWKQLRPASYRGVGFTVIGGSARFGRRNAVHEYPFRDMPWIEDLGRSARRILITGFIFGDDVIAQRDKLIAACEKPGDGELVHPTLGRRTVALLDVSTTEHMEQGRVFEISFSFIEQGQRLYPEAKASTKAAVTTAAAGVDSAGALAFVAKAATALQSGAAAVLAVVGVESAWAQTALSAANDCASLFNLAVSLPGQFGRLAALGSPLNIGQVLPSLSGVTVQDLIAQAAVARQSIGTAVGGLTGAGEVLGVSTAGDYATSAQAVAASVMAAGPTPADALRGLIGMAVTEEAGGLSGAPQTMQLASGDLFRRAAVSAAAQASANYQPASTDDAVAVRTQVLAVIDLEITRAGDNGEDGVYTALRTLRASVVSDMNVKGAALPTLVTVETGSPVPSLALAQRLYRDSTRSDELVRRAAPKHPAFMPVEFKALNA